ncbi:hypothetical protein PI124_g1446 [Phytophthora idaei]|nr:hypothetical protein PI125_g929 [Phytophthora idaei]KAG3173770.1 hypothetical protein PI126_g686 [Phytophthora idaei]KAG3254014.1 hypothetical protein PI124_g1446 [Phytophthora idaei]
MTTQGNSKGLDELGQEVLWSSRGQQVMMQWEKQYMEVCVDALAIQPTDRVLEIGFGLAYSATHIQRFRPRNHVIIECDRETLQRAQQFAVNHSGVVIVSGTWKRQLPTLDQFDCVFFDDYPFTELEQGNPLTSDGALGRQRSRWHDFLDIAVKHCTTGARITGYLARQLDLQRPGCQVSVSRVQVDVPEHCNYFPHKTALVPLITVVDPIAAASSANAGIDMLLPLPHSSKKFERAFECASSSERGLHAAGFPREREQITEIRDFLLAHELCAFSYEQRDDIERSGGGTEDDQPSNESILYGEQHEKEEGSIHYNDEKSRREFLRTLRNKAAASKLT